MTIAEQIINSPRDNDGDLQLPDEGWRCSFIENWFVHEFKDGSKIQEDRLTGECEAFAPRKLK